MAVKEISTDAVAHFKQLVRDKSLRLLAQREQSSSELRRKLQTATFGARAQSPDTDELDVDTRYAIIEKVLEDLSAAGLQSDIRFAEYLCRWRYESGSGPVKLKHELCQHQLDADLVADSLAPYAKKWSKCAAAVLVKKFGEQPPSSYPEWARRARFLQSRGFSEQHIPPYNG